MNFSLEKLQNLKEVFGHYGYREVYFVSDLVMLPIIILAIHLFLRWRRSKQPLELQPYFLKGYYFRYLGLAIFLLYHLVLDKSGVDTLTYYWASHDIFQVFKSDPNLALKIIFYSTEEINQLPISEMLSPYLRTDSESEIIRLAAVVGFFTGYSYFGTSIILGVFSFAGCWKIFKTLYRIYPKAKKHLAIACLFVPSVVVWSAAISKEIVCIGAMGYFFASFVGIFIFKERRALNWIILLVTTFVLAKIKIYILIGLFAAMLFFFVVRIIKKIKSTIIKLIVVPFLILFFSATGYISFTVLGSQLTFFSPDTIIQTAVRTYVYLSMEGRAGSRYDLGTFEPSPAGLARIAPSGLVVTLFRPFVWEANKPIALLAALESLLLTVLLFYVFLRVGFIRSFRLILSEPLITFAFIFVIIFSIAVGVTSGNFGTLVRYKIPLMPFLFSAMAILYSMRAQSQIEQS